MDARDVVKLWMKTYPEMDALPADKSVYCTWGTSQGALPHYLAEPPPARDVASEDGAGASGRTLPLPPAEGEASRTPPPDAALESFLGYRVEAEVGRGGMGVVYQAEQMGLHRAVAVKQLLTAPPSPWVLESFLAEARVTGLLDHPNIVPIHELGTTEEGRAWFSMKFIRGISWRNLLHPETPEHRRLAGTFDLERHLQVLLSVCNAAAFAHSRGYIHRDLKPDNVMIGEFGEVLVIDWGIAVEIVRNPPDQRRAIYKDEATQPTGTPCYMSPEQAMGQGPMLGPWTDVFLLGGILHEILVGQPPHSGSTVRDVIQAAAEARPPVFPPGVSTGLAAICRKALSREIADRYADASAMEKDLSLFLQHRASLRISEEAEERLLRCRARVGAGVQMGERQAVIAEMSEVVSAFRQASKLWDGNEAAIRGERRARLLYAKTAADAGDLILAQVQWDAIPAVSAFPEDASEIAEWEREGGRIRRLRHERALAQRRLRDLRLALGGTALLLFFALLAGYLLVRKQSRIAQDRLSEVLRLSDVKRLADYEAEADALWPARASRVAEMQVWLSKASELVERIPMHRATLRRLQARGASSAEERWELDMVGGLVSGLDAFARPDTGTLARMESRLDLAQRVERETLSERAAEWSQALAELAATEPGLLERPIVGLVPLGADSHSGFQEFAMPETGTTPRRLEDGTLVREPDFAMVLVLLPGGHSCVGAVPASSTDAAGSVACGNLDPGADPDEGPVREVDLAPYFISKYELTQGQWLRMTGKTPARFKPGETVGGHVVHLGYPVDQVGAQEADTILARLELALPSESQWEQAARGGTSTAWWTGADKASLAGAANLADRYCMLHGGPRSWRYEEGLDDGFAAVAPTGSFRPNAFGLHDVAGNVWEWTTGRMENKGEGTGSRLDLRPGETLRVARGGAWDGISWRARSAHRRNIAPGLVGNVGMRPVRSVPSPEGSLGSVRPGSSASPTAREGSEP